jgi:predicted signal transduction protein with EAL and GGDEF domain
MSWVGWVAMSSASSSGTAQGTDERIRSIEELLREADIALRHGKRSGRGNVTQHLQGRTVAVDDRDHDRDPDQVLIAR